MERISKWIGELRERVCDLFAWEKHYLPEPDVDWKESLMWAIRQAAGEIEDNEIHILAEGFGAWCRAKRGACDYIAIKRADGAHVYEIRREHKEK